MMKDLRSLSGMDLRLNEEQLRLNFGADMFYPDGEVRTLQQARPMLADTQAQGPDHLYTIYMDIGRKEDFPAIEEQGLLYGSVVYNHGTLGNERLRSQGHIHSEKSGTGLRYSEVYEFWTGHGQVYLQKECAPDVTRAYLVPFGPGDKLVIPFGWVHLVVTEGEEPVSFGAWCARENQLEYAHLRSLGGPAYFFLADGTLARNPRYTTVPEVRHATPADFPLLGIPTDRPMYTSWQENPELYTFMANPELVGDIWRDF
ncbi:hypothetical protein KDA_54310 [Dictyobacter alpinus]|uniref:glucose-6-phosphate isomerase n=1 Tax=Dictyobacter alpinus TaxID=2014873 RepID=A0A402BFC1_9CHLR|nr:glucose-6-phosphate isomerase family protein [Dictyobacter alpinus]GCE29947.1 hypothetical protein KDA_54310 [Dictyobacter alpinus]